MFCTACGAQHPIGDLFCKHCGHATHPFKLVHKPESLAQAVPQLAAPLPGYAYADIWKRLAALQIDIALSLGLLALVFFAFGHTFDPNTDDEFPTDPAPYVAWIGLVLLYYLWMDASRWQGTFGKQALGLKVTDREGKRISKRSSLVRLAARPLAVIPIGVGFLSLQGYPARQTWYDRLAGNVVLSREEPSPAPRSSTPGL